MLDSTETLLSAKDVADCLGISVRSVWRWAAMGKIPGPIKLTSHVVRWKSSEIQSLIGLLSAGRKLSKTGCQISPPDV
jgi:predicted DNA-binding transcriptional regulator AlpA